MNFQPELAEAILNGEKWVTRRPVSENPNSPYHPSRAPRMAGKTIAICPGRGKRRIGEAAVIAAVWEHFDPKAIELEEVQAEGFSSRLDFLDTWVRLNGPEPVPVWRIELDRDSVREHAS